MTTAPSIVPGIYVGERKSPRRSVWSVISFALFTGPLYIRIVVALSLGAIAGVIFGARMAHIALPAQIVLQFLNAIAPPMIMVAVIRALVTANVNGKDSARMSVQFLFNTLFAITLGLVIANTLKPGLHAHFDMS